jgi:hypothetical protein
LTELYSKYNNFQHVIPSKIKYITEKVCVGLPLRDLETERAQLPALKINLNPPQIQRAFVGNHIDLAKQQQKR